MQKTTANPIVVIGGGAAGYFGAINTKLAWPNRHVLLLEATKRPLTKVKISGGGRCNVTHQCFDPLVLASNYPRGHRELRGAFSRFQPLDTIKWFKERGVTLKAEADGRMFPESDDSSTIVNCLRGELEKCGAQELLGTKVSEVNLATDGGFDIICNTGMYRAGSILLATGSAPIGYRIAQGLSHSVTELVPSLFTFNVDDDRLRDLPGLSFDDVKLELRFKGSPKKLRQQGALLITHWGLSGPGVLKLSAWGAAELHREGYKAELYVNFLPKLSKQELSELLSKSRDAQKNSLLYKSSPTKAVPKRYWQKNLAWLGMDSELRWAQLSNAALALVVESLSAAKFLVDGKGVFKEEFVTCGGVARSEVDFKTMQSRRVKGLYFAGEVIDIDAITGGFNFQNAWTTAFIAAQNIGAP